ncbi:MAG: hypothetical protein Q8P73_01215 [bacterium]|nr:hypothetical protein [bacterium]
MLERMKTTVKDKAIKLWRRANGQPKKMFNWYVLGNKATIPPDLYKQRMVKKIGRKSGIRVFVETGTYKGDMTLAASRVFEKVYSIELHKPFYDKAVERFAGNNRVEILYGDSASVVKDLMRKIDEPCVFWLDAHGGQASKDGAGIEGPAPVDPELRAILNHSKAAQHIILIDDAHTFIRDQKWGKGVWGQIENLRKEWLEKHPEWVWKIKDNVVHIYKTGNEQRS